MTPLLVSNLTNIRYLTGLTMTAGVMLLMRKRHILFVDDRYIEKARKEAKRGIAVLPIERLDHEVSRLNLTVTRLQRWRQRFRGTKLVPSQGVIEVMRRRKKKSEIEAIVKACRITDRTLKLIPRKLRTGISEQSLAWEIQKMARDFGASCMAFETIVAFGPHTSRPHHRPTKRKLKKGDLVQIDMGVKVDGYCSDCSRVFLTGKPTEEQLKVHSLLIELVKETTKMAKTGTLTSTLDRHARNALNREGYSEHFLHSLGHGLGLDVHEGVNLTSRLVGARRSVPIQTNEIITIEPGVYLEGTWGMRVEDTVQVTKTGGKRLTKAKY
jgi:Xaa-Pro aminopeptidase